jgi:hypothetical protein
LKYFITFGQGHKHTIQDKTFDKDCIAVFEADDYNQARDKASQLFQDVWCFIYDENTWKESNLEYFPRGYLEAS